MTRLVAFPLLFALSLLPVAGAEQGVPSRAEARALFGEVADRMAAAAIVTPELARAGAPLTENVRQAIVTLDSGQSREHVGVLYALLRNAQIYLQLADALPKSAGFSTDARAQLEQLRVKLDAVEVYFRDVLDRREMQVLGADRDNIARYAEENGVLASPVVGERRVIFMGDSITDGWRLNQYFPGKPYVNRGIGGQVTGQMLGRMLTDVIENEPEVMVLLAGTNDLARGVSLDTIQDNITMILDLAEAHGIVPVVSSILPVSDHHAEQEVRFRRTTLRPPAQIRELNDWLRQEAQTRGIPYIDYHAATEDETGQLRAELADDGLHPNAEGYKLMAPLAEAAIEQALATRRTAPAPKKKRFGVF